MSVSRKNEGTICSGQTAVMRLLTQSNERPSTDMRSNTVRFSKGCQPMTHRRITAMTLTILIAIGTGATTCFASDTTPATTTDPAKQTNRVYHSIPADAFFVAYVRDVDEALTQPLLEPIFQEAPEAKPVFTALTDAFDGPLAVSISGTPIMPFLWRFAILTQTNLDDVTFSERLGTLATAWNASPLSVMGSLTYVAGEVDRILFAGPASFSVDVIHRDDLIIATTLVGFDQWLQTAPPEGLFANKAEWGRMNNGLSPAPAAFAYLDLRAIVPLTMMPLGNSLPKLYDALQLAYVQSAALIIGQTPPIVVAPDEKMAQASDSNKKSTKPNEKTDELLVEGKPVVRLALSVKNDAPGPWHLIASNPIMPTLTTAYPTDTTIFLHSSMSSGAGLMDDVLAFQKTIDTVLTDEYAQERADFKRDVGFDPHSDFLANLAGEWAFGGKLGEHGIEQPLFTARIADEDRFRAQLRSLRDYFKLQTTITTYRGVNIETAERNAGNFSFAMARKTLLISSEPQAVADAIDALIDKKNLSQSRDFVAAGKHISEPTAKFGYVDLRAVNELVRSAIPTPKTRDALTRAAAKGDLVMTVVPRNGAITADFYIGQELGTAATLAICDSMKEVQKQSARTVSMANMRGIVMSCIIYAADNKNQWPPSLDELVKTNFIAPQVLNSPYESQDAAASTEPFFLYRPVANPTAVKEPAKEVVLAESKIREGGACFAFMDGHVEYITGQQAERLLAMMKKVK